MAGTKRKHNHDSPEELYSSKSRSRPSVEARVDPTYGQRNAIPLDEDGGSDEGNGELNYGEEMDAMAYLRSVRREAFGIPNLLVAPRASLPNNCRDIYEDGTGDYRGRYEDGAFYAPEADFDDCIENSEVSQNTLAAYYDAVLARFYDLRSRLQVDPPLKAIQLLDESRPTFVERLTLDKVKWWRWKMRTTDPLPAQVASMDKGTVLKLLTVLTGGALLKRGSEIEFGISRWAWSLLARLPARGELTSEEIGVVRELSKKAVLVGVGLKEETDWEEGIQEVEAGYEEDVEGDKEETIDLEHSDAISLVDDDVNEVEECEGSDDLLPEEEVVINMPSYQRLDLKTAIPGDDEVSALPLKVERPNGNVMNEQKTVLKVDEDELSAAKARVLNLLKGSSQGPGIMLQPGVDVTEKVNSAKRVHIEGHNTETQSTKLNTKATVDMIITVAGEVYGQRDLLEFRSQ